MEGAAPSIRGQVLDASGGELPGATVMLSNATKIIATAIADEHGRFGFDDVPPGVYEIAATLQGFINATERVVIVEGGLVQQLELRLSVGGITETVTVTGESPLIQVARSTTSGRQKTGVPFSITQTLPLWVASSTQGSGRSASTVPRVTPNSPDRAWRWVTSAARVWFSPTPALPPLATGGWS